MIFDSDVFIWLERGNEKALSVLEATDSSQRLVALQSYLELLQRPQDKDQQNRTKKFFGRHGFQILPLSAGIGHRAAIYIEQYALSHGLRAGDAIIAATAIENGEVLCTANTKHYRAIKDLEIKGFRP